MSLRPKKQKATKRAKKKNTKPKDIKPDWMPLWAAERMHYKKDMIMSNPDRAFAYPFAGGTTNKKVAMYWLGKAHKAKTALARHEVKHIDIEYLSTYAKVRIMLKPMSGYGIDIRHLTRTIMGNREDYRKYQDQSLVVTQYADGVEIYLMAAPKDSKKLRAMWK